MAEKIDLKRDLQHLYRPSAKAPVIVEVPAMNFLMIDGAGNPNTSLAYADEGPTIQGLHRFAEAQGYHLHGLHHEIYLSDPRRTTPEKLKTVIRQPVRQ